MSGTPPAARMRSAPFSTHARGVPLLDRGRLLDVPRHASRALLSLRDLSSSFAWLLAQQSWLTFWSVATTVASAAFFSYYDKPDGGDAPLGAQLDWSAVGFVVFLPLVAALWAAWARRERALDLLSEVKTLALSLLDAHGGWVSPSRLPAGHVPGVADALLDAVAAARAYLAPGRFYSRSYPYMGYKAAMVQIALDRARAQRALGAALRQLGAAAAELRGAGLPPPLEALLHERVARLALALDRLAAVKEFRTPQGVRSASRFYCGLFVPLFFGPYWAWLANETDFAFAFFFAVLFQVALAALVNTALALEDPFDNAGLDGAFVDEPLFEVEAAALRAGGGAPGGAPDGGAGGGAPGLPPLPGRPRSPTRARESVRVTTDEV